MTIDHAATQQADPETSPATGAGASPNTNAEVSQTLTLDPTELAADVTRYVIVEANASDYGFPTDATVELMSSSAVAVTRVPKSPDFIRGVINHRGSIIPVVNTRRLLGLPCVETQAGELVRLLDTRQREHSEWLDALEHALRTGEPFDKQTDPTKCAFGCWYQETMSDEARLRFLSRFDQTLRSTLAEMDSPHRRIHGLSEKLLGMRADGRTDEALTLLERERGTTLGELNRLFAKVRSAAERGIKTMLVITELGDRRAAFEVDAVHTVKDCADDDIECLPDTATGSEFMRGLVHQPNGRYVLICDLEQMYSLACPK